MLIGLPVQCSNKTISVAALIENKKIKRYIGKKTIRSRDESSYLSPSKGCEYIKIAGKKVAVVVGEDIHTEQEYGEYADLIINLCNSPYSRGIIEKRYDFYRQLAFMTGKSIVFVNNVGAQTDIVYDGSSGIINSRGEAVTLLKSFFRRIFESSNWTPTTNRCGCPSRIKPSTYTMRSNWDCRIISPKTDLKPHVWGFREVLIRRSSYRWPPRRSAPRTCGYC